MRPWWAVLLVAAVWLVLRRSLLLVSVRGISMVPTYHDGDLLLAVRRWPPGAGRAVVFVPPGGTDPADPPYRVKRIAAVAGDPVPDWVADAEPGRLVPPGRLVVRGDGERSEDSRTYGLVDERAVVAVVLGRVSGGRPG